MKYSIKNIDPDHKYILYSIPEYWIDLAGLAFFEQAQSARLIKKQKKIRKDAKKKSCLCVV